MKIKLLSTAILLGLFTTAAFSQKINVGIKGGTDLFKIKGESFDEQFNFGFHVGAFAEFKVKKIGIQPEIYFSEVSTDTKTGSSSADVLYGVDKIKFSYLNIPILANIYFNQNVALQVGPQFGVLINQDLSKDGNFGNTVNDAFKNGDFSLTGGLQLKFSKIRVYGRYVIGLNDKNNLDDALNNETWKSQTIHLGVAFAFL
jgi:hypothetical protein